MFKQLALSLCAGLLLGLPACCCKDKCSAPAKETETSIDAQTCSETQCDSAPTESTESAPAKF